MINWLRRQPTFAEVLWMIFMIECLRLIVNGETIPAFWHGLTN